MAEAGVHMIDIRAMLGHADIAMTARYAHATDEGMRRAVEAISDEVGHKLATLEERAARG